LIEFDEYVLRKAPFRGSIMVDPLGLLGMFKCNPPVPPSWWVDVGDAAAAVISAPDVVVVAPGGTDVDVMVVVEERVMIE
jgi:hypothetical protein